MATSDTVIEETLKRWEQLEVLQKEYADFEPFLIDVMEDLMGFVCTDVQIDIGKFLQFGPDDLMIQAQRSQAKSSIVAIFSVWCLIHDPKYRVLILSAGSDVAMEIANWVIQIIMNWDILKCMRPDKQHGDRSSVKAFDVHWQLKGVEKSPSVACIGVTANMQGRRADLLIPDDIESSKNGLTEVQRQQLQHLSKDFTSICQNGRICYLGTPQTTDSIYNALPGRGYTIRIWPGRYPTNEQLPNYGTHLAPMLLARIKADPSLQTGGGPMGDAGQAIDPVLLPEKALTKKEIDQGPAYFQLQHMLSTELMDSDRHPLKLSYLINIECDLEVAPGELSWMPDPVNMLKIPGLPDEVTLYRPFVIGKEMFRYENRGMYVDPAGGGQNGDETVATVGYFLHGYIHITEQLAIKGGFTDDVFEQLSALALRHKVNCIQVEQNYGNGMFAQMWRPILLKAYKEDGKPGAPQIEDVFESGQKELRIIDTLEPVNARHRIVIHEDVWRKDVEQCQRYPVAERTVYSLWNQFSKITREKGALIHDDRVDSLAGCVRIWVDRLAVDESDRIAQKQTNEAVEFMNQWADSGAPEERTALRAALPKQRKGLFQSRTLNRRPSNRRTRR